MINKKIYSLLSLLCLCGNALCGEPKEKPRKDIRKKRQTSIQNSLNNNEQKTSSFIPIKDFSQALGISPSLYAQPTE